MPVMFYILLPSMSTTQSSSSIPPHNIRKLIDETPFLDLGWHFDAILSVKERVDKVRSAKPTVPAGMIFANFAAEREAQLSESAKKIVAALMERGDEESGIRIETLDLFAEFIVGLEPTEPIPEALISYYDQLEKYIEFTVSDDTDRIHFGRTIWQIALDPGLKWHDHEGVDSDVALRILEPLESAARRLSELLRSSFDAHLLESQNNLICCCLVLAGYLGTSFSRSIVSDHLLVFRRVSPVAWERIDSRLRMQYATLVLHLTLLTFPADEPFRSVVGFSENTLADLRNVFRDAAGTTVSAPFTVHQWVFRWFADKLDADVFSTRRFAGSLGSLAVLSEGEQAATVELARRFASYRLPVTVQHLSSFLLQFGTTDRIRGALRILMHCKFFPLWELGESMVTMLRAELGDDPEAKLVITPLGDQTGSTAIIKYLASHSSLSGHLVFASDVSSALAQTKAGDKLHFVDDCLLSGTQTLNILGDLTGNRRRKPHHTKHCDPLSINDIVELSKRSLIFSYCVVTDTGMTRFMDGVTNAGIDPTRVALRYGVVEPSSSKAFEPLGPVSWSNSNERETLKAFAAEVGYDILEHRAHEKGWDDARRRESALGFSDFQRLLIFPYNVPKTTITLLWEHGNETRAWNPLFQGFD